jgi:hypothetical protein
VKLPRERLLMLVLLAALPLGLYGLLVRPSLRRLEALHQRIREADEAFPFHPFVPVGREERAWLEAPAAPWRERMPRLAGDRDRLAHLAWVAGEVSAAMRAGGVEAAAMRAAMDPVSADCTLPAALRAGPAPPSSGPDQPECKVRAWVLDVQVPGGTADLFKALAAVPQARPLVEPVGLRWEAGPGPAGGRVRLSLLLRNFYLE